MKRWMKQKGSSTFKLAMFSTKHRNVNMRFPLHPSASEGPINSLYRSCSSVSKSRYENRIFNVTVATSCQSRSQTAITRTRDCRSTTLRTFFVSLTEGMGIASSKETEIVTIRATERGMLSWNLSQNLPKKLEVTRREPV